MATYMSDREIRKIERDRKKEEDRLKRQNEKQRLQKEDKRTREQSKRDTKERERLELQKQRERLLQERRKLKEKSKLISEMEKRINEGRKIETDKRQSSDSDKDLESDPSETDDDYKEIERVESNLNTSKEDGDRRDESKEKEKRENRNKESISLNTSEYKKRRSRSMERADNSENEYPDLDKSVEANTNVKESFSEERLKDNKGTVQDDDTIAQIATYLKDGVKPSAQQTCTSDLTVRKYLREWNHLVLQDGVVYRRGQLNDQEYLQLVLPTHPREEIFLALHDDLGHQGRDRTTSLFKQRFYWPGMDSWIEERVRQCDRCTKRKTFPSIAPLVNFSSSTPMEILCIDFLSLEKSKGGHEHILVLTDHFTRYSQAYPTKNQTAKTTARVLFDQFIVHYGFPARIHSDQGANFESSLIKELCQLAGIAKSHTTPYHPMGNPVERFNSTLLKMLGTLENNMKSDWKSHIAPLVHAYNVTIHPSTRFSPYFLMFGRHPKLAIDALLGFPSQTFNSQNQHEYINKLKTKLAAAYKKAEETSKLAAAKNKERYDIRAKANRLKPGDLVLARNVNIRGKHKLADRWEDIPYIVVSQPNDDLPVYEILKDCRNAKKTRVLHRNHLLPLGMKHRAYESVDESVDFPTTNATTQESNDTNLDDTGDISEESE